MKRKFKKCMSGAMAVALLFTATPSNAMAGSVPVSSDNVIEQENVTVSEGDVSISDNREDIDNPDASEENEALNESVTIVDELENEDASDEAKENASPNEDDMPIENVSEDENVNSGQVPAAKYSAGFKETYFVKDIWEGNELYSKEMEFKLPTAGRIRFMFNNCVNPKYSERILISDRDYLNCYLVNEVEKAYTYWIAASAGIFKVQFSSQQTINPEATLCVEYQPGGSYLGETERNDSFDTANEIPLNTNFWGSDNRSGDDDDYFYFKINRPSKIDIKIDDIYNCLYLYKEDQYGNIKLLSKESLNRDGRSVFPTMRLPAGKYYLKMDSDSFGYNIYVGLTEESDQAYEQEENDLSSKANKKELNMWYTGNINKYDNGSRMYDKDWYRFNVSQRSYIAEELETPRGKAGHLTAALYNEALEKITEITTTSNPYLKSKEKLLEPGVYYICVTSDYNLESYWDYRIRLYQRNFISLQSILLPSSKTMTIGQAATLPLTLVPSNANGQTFNWKSSNPKAVTVYDGGRVSAKSAGTAIITVSSRQNSGISAQCRIKVIKGGAGQGLPSPGNKPVKLNKQNLAIKVGSAAKLKLSNAQGKITWKIGNPSIATVSQSGVVKGKKIGKTTVKAVSGGKTYSCKVTVNSKFEKGVWYGYSNGGFYFWIHKVSGKKMNFSVYMPNMSINKRTAAIKSNGKAATARFTCGEGKTHSLTISLSGRSIKVQEKSSCIKKLVSMEAKNSNKIIKHTFRPSDWVWYRY